MLYLYKNPGASHGDTILYSIELGDVISEWFLPHLYCNETEVVKPPSYVLGIKLYSIDKHFIGTLEYLWGEFKAIQ